MLTSTSKPYVQGAVGTADYEETINIEPWSSGNLLFYANSYVHPYVDTYTVATSTSVVQLNGITTSCGAGHTFRYKDYDGGADGSTWVYKTQSSSSTLANWTPTTRGVYRKIECYLLRTSGPAIGEADQIPGILIFKHIQSDSGRWDNVKIISWTEGHITKQPCVSIYGPIEVCDLAPDLYIPQTDVIRVIPNHSGYTPGYQYWEPKRWFGIKIEEFTVEYEDYWPSGQSSAAFDNWIRFEGDNSGYLISQHQWLMSNKEVGAGETINSKWDFSGVWLQGTYSMGPPATISKLFFRFTKYPWASATNYDLERAVTFKMKGRVELRCWDL